MLNDPLVKSLLTTIVEDEANLAVIESLNDGIETDEEIAEKTGIKLNIVRKILYKLYDKGLASYKRSKDSETQWFTYSWKFESNEIKRLVKEENEKAIKYYSDILEEENNVFFICPEGHVRFDYNLATQYDFMCPECGEELVFHDNTSIIKECKEIIENCKETFEKFSEKNG